MAKASQTSKAHSPRTLQSANASSWSGAIYGKNTTLTSRALAQIDRAKFPHRLDAQLGESEANDFYKNFSSDDRMKLEQVY